MFRTRLRPRGPIATAFGVPALLLAAAVAAPFTLGADDDRSAPPATGVADAGLEIREWQVPWPNSRPRDPYVADDSTVWFVGQRANYLGTLNPHTGEFERYDLPEGAAPHNVIVGPDGTVWYAGNGDAHIGRVDPRTGEVTAIHRMPDPAARDPHTLAMGPDGDIWFTVQGGNFVGRLMTDTGEIDLVPVPTPRARPYGIVVDPSGRPWFAEFGSHKIGTVDPGTLELEEYSLPRTEARPRRIALTPDGGVWYDDYEGGFLGRLDPASGDVREWPLPSGEESRPYALAVDGRGRLWVAETGPSPNRLVGFDPRTERFIEATPIPSGAGTVRHMVFDPASRSLWFGTDANTIGRARLP